jgi:hypothetical protein
MNVDSLDELTWAFEEWRRAKKHAREAMPEELLVRARRAAKTHGVTAVVGATRVERERLFRARPARMKTQGATSGKPTVVPRSILKFSRLELSAPSAPSARPRPIAEVETGSGVTLRVFEQTPEMMGLVSAVCGFGGLR